MEARSDLPNDAQGGICMSPRIECSNGPVSIFFLFCSVYVVETSSDNEKQPLVRVFMTVSHFCGEANG